MWSAEPDGAWPRSSCETLAGRGETLATAESLTGGQLSARLTDVPGASRCFVGGVVSYATRVKVSLLGVPAEVVEEYGVVSEECAAAMAHGVRDRLAATYGLATTGVAGPDSQEGQRGRDGVGRVRRSRGGDGPAAVARRRPGRDPAGVVRRGPRAPRRELGDDRGALSAKPRQLRGKKQASGSVGAQRLPHPDLPESKDSRMVLFRRLLGDVLRSARMQRGMTLRELSAEARVSLGYISEIERGQKEASSELLASLCQAMDLPLSDVLRDVADAVAIEEAALGLVVSTPIDVGRRAGDVVASAA